MRSAYRSSYLEEQGLAADIAKANANLQLQTNEINAGLQKQWLANGKKNVLSSTTEYGTWH